MNKILFLLTIIICIVSGNNIETPLSNLSETKSTIKSTVTNLNTRIIDTDEYIKVSLIDVVLETVAQSNNAKAAREKVRQAKIKIDNAKAEYLPSLNGTYKISRTDSRPGDNDEEKKFYNDESYKLTLSQNLYEGGETSANIKNLEKKYEVEKNNYRLTIAKEIQNAIKAYFDVLFNFQSFNVNLQNMESLNEILEIVNIKYESGATSIGNLSNIKANVSNAESKLIRVQSKFNESLEYYEYVVGDKFTQTFPFEESFDTTVDDFEEIVEKAIQNNITIKNYDLNIAAEKMNLLKATASFKPQIDLELSAEDIVDQEDYETDEENYKAQMIFSYNFYNKGKDKNQILLINSKIRELRFRKKEEIRKLKWSLSKLHRSIISITNAIESKKEEVAASEDMVEAYWDGFKLGEQDLQELLQGQRQLNSAQTELINNKKSTITDYFKLLDSTATLLSFFRLDIDADNYIDFTRSDYKNLLKSELKQITKKKNEDNNITLNGIVEDDTTSVIDNNESAITDLNISLSDFNISENIENNVTKNQIKIVERDKLDKLLAFENKFLTTDENKWTIWIYYFDKVYQALDFAKENNISTNSFIFDTLMNNTVKSNIAYNIFDTEELAYQSVEDLNITKVDTKVLPIKDIKTEHNNFMKKKLQKKVKKKKVFSTNSVFKRSFLNAPQEYYTINITSLSSMNEAEKLVTNEKIYENSFIFSYGEEKEWVKVLYGVFKTYEEANESLMQLESIKNRYEPIIEIIESKQNLYKKYHNDDIPSNIIEPFIEETQVKDKASFKEKFLSASKEYYTINLATLFYEQDANRFENKYTSKLNLFLFKFGKEKTYFKAVSGVFLSEEEALNAIENLPYELKRNKPRVEKISNKQNLYWKYNTKSNKLEVN